MAELVVSNVTKRYGDVLAVDDVSFAAQPGRILGVLGPNGAGKTSIIRMITYITIPDTGDIQLGGKNVGPWSQDVMGYLPEERGLYKKLKVGEQLLYLAELRGISKKNARERISYWLDRFDASGWADKKTEELSKGMQQKVQFIATVLPDPSLIILDEPFSGLDPINAELLRDIISEMKDKGRTILFASHRMEQVEQICDDICLISNGRVLIDGALRDIKQSFGRDTILLEMEGSLDFLQELERKQQVRVISQTNHRAELRLVNGSAPRSVLESAMQNGEVYRFQVVEPPLNEIFVSSVQKQRASGVERKALEAA